MAKVFKNTFETSTASLQAFRIPIRNLNPISKEFCDSGKKCQNTRNCLIYILNVSKARFRLPGTKQSTNIDSDPNGLILTKNVKISKRVRMNSNFHQSRLSGLSGTNPSNRTSLNPIQSQSRVPGHLLTNSEILDNPQLVHLPSSPYHRTFKGEWFALPAVSLEAKNHRFYSFINEWSRIAGPGSHPFKGNLQTHHGLGNYRSTDLSITQVPFVFLYLCFHCSHLLFFISAFIFHLLF